LEIERGTVVANRYRILRPLGRGGMGEVFAAENIRTGRPVAIKLLHADSKTKESSIARFQREARAAGSINSDHVTQVLDVEDDAEYGIVLVFELLEGESLIERLKRTGPIPFEELHPFIEQVWIGLADAHRAGIIHRDLKPSNVFLERRPDGTTRVKILDFGISKLPKEMEGQTLTEVGQSLGTFTFMPPEQIGKAKTVDHRADIYACATLIYQSLTGQLPYPARNVVVLIEMKRTSDPRSLAEAVGTAFDPRLEAFVARALSRDPSRRFQSAVEALGAWREIRPRDAADGRAVHPGYPAAGRSTPSAPASPPLMDPGRRAVPEPASDDSAATIALPYARLLGGSPSAPQPDPRLSAYQKPSNLGGTTPMAHAAANSPREPPSGPHASTAPTAPLGFEQRLGHQSPQAYDPRFHSPGGGGHSPSSAPFSSGPYPPPQQAPPNLVVTPGAPKKSSALGWIMGFATLALLGFAVAAVLYYLHPR
jgi:serine/threonine-protein kinase